MTKQRFEYIDQIRGFAVLFVFFFHAFGTAFGKDQFPFSDLTRNFDVSKLFILFSPLSFGWSGVAIFFAVSGFCIHVSFMGGKNHGWTGFFCRRFFRLYPAYLASIIFFFFVYPFGGFDFAWHRSYQLIMHALLIQNFDQVTFYGLNASLWSLAIEAQLYLLYPVMFYCGVKYGWKKSFISLFAIELTLRLVASLQIYLYSGNSDFTWPIFDRLPFFYIGSWFSGVYLANEWITKKSLPFKNQSISIWLLLFFLSQYFLPLTSFSFPIVAFITTIMLAKNLDKPSGNKSLLPGVLRFYGKVSYSLYLIHQPWLSVVLGIAGYLGLGNSPFATMSACVLALLPLTISAYLIFRYVEQPSIRMGSALLPGRNT